ncbi:MAG: pitrilysin family protein [Candidatus Omnitrophota bacterium]
MTTTLNGNPLLPYTEIRLPSGFTLVHKELRMAPIIAIDMWIGTGAVHDPEPHLGLSHFYEHMFFKGTERFGVGVMDRIITSLGGYNNAATSLDYTHYYVVLPSFGWKTALEVMIDSLRHPLFDPEEIERERSVVLEEIKRSEDNPWSKIYDEFTSLAFSRCPYRRNVLGTQDSLQTITRDSFNDYLRNRYHPKNVTISIVGDIGLQETQDELNRLLGDFVQEAPSEANRAWDVINAPSEIVIERDVNQSYLLIGYPTPKLLGTSREYALDILSMILGEGRSSRLHRRLNDELGIVSSIGCDAWNLTHAGLFMIEAVTEPSKIPQVEAEIESELKKAREKITEEELEKSKSMSRADFAFSNEKMISIAHTYGYGRITEGIDYAVHYQEEIEKVTLQDLAEVYDRYLSPQRRCRGLLLPKHP